MKYLGELGLILILILLIVITVPLIIGVIVAFSVGLTGFQYITVVIGIAIIIWTILGAYYYL